MRQQLEQLIQTGAGKGLPVVFDFDNTLVCRDIGEATAAVLAKEGRFCTSGHAKAASPSFMLNDSSVSLATSASVLKYYEAVLDATHHQHHDSAPYANAYAWLTQALADLTPAEVISATEKAYGSGRAERDLGSYPGETKTDVGPGGVSYRVPFFYPEMVELVGVLLANGYDVWVVSASNVWTVRWMVMKVLNSKLRRQGVTKGIPPDHVIGVSVLLRGPDGKLYKDPPLARENPAYANLEAEELARFTLTASLCYPLTGYHGKVANILQWIGSQPYLVAGDSPNDHPMLAFGRHRLWLARLEKASYQRKTLDLIGRMQDGGTWLVQPVLYKKSPGFVSGARDLPSRLQGAEKRLQETVDLLQQQGHLGTPK